MNQAHKYGRGGGVLASKGRELRGEDDGSPTEKEDKESGAVPPSIDSLLQSLGIAGGAAAVTPKMAAQFEDFIAARTAENSGGTGDCQEGGTAALPPAAGDGLSGSNSNKASMSVRPGHIAGSAHDRPLAEGGRHLSPADGGHNSSQYTRAKGDDSGDPG